MTEMTHIARLGIGDVIGVFKPRIAFAIMLSAIGGAAISPGHVPDADRMLLVALAVFLAAASAGAFNQWAESDLDSRMARTATRPFASGLLHPGIGWLSAIVALLAVSVLLANLAGNEWVAVYTFSGAFTYAIIYTLWLKRRTWLNIVVGGLAGSFAVLAGAALVDPGLAPEPLFLTIVLFLWTPPHFWSLAIAANDDYAKNGVPMLPAVLGNKASAYIILAHTIALSLVALLPAIYSLGNVYLLCAIAGGLLFTVTSVRLVIAPSRRRAIHNFLASLIQLVVLLMGAVLDRWLIWSL